MSKEIFKWKDWASGEDLSGIDKKEIRSERISTVGAIAVLVYYTLNPCPYGEEIKESNTRFLERHTGVPEINKKFNVVYIHDKFRNFYKYHEILFSAYMFQVRIFEWDGFLKDLINCVKEKENKKMILRKAFMEAEEYLLELFREYNKK